MSGNTLDEKKINKPMRILTGIAIIQVVMGHLDLDVLSLGGLFPYYSFHVMVFLFVSGYFYKPDREENVIKYICNKAKHLLLPYYIWNLIYGIISTCLAREDFSFCNTITPYNFLIEPFLGGHQYGFNFAAWFVPALFVIEVINICGRKLLSFIRLNKEPVILVITLICGVLCVYLAQTGHVWGILKTPGRIIFMLPVYEMGRFYKVSLEERMNNVSDALYFPVVVAVQFILLFISNGAVNFSAVWCTGFASLPIMPYLTVMTGTLFWLRVSECIARVGGCRPLERIGQDSFAVMMHHIFVAFIVNSILLLICNLVNPEFSFDLTQYKSNINYVYLVRGIYAWKLVVTVISIVGSIYLSNLEKVFLRLVQKR